MSSGSKSEDSDSSSKSGVENPFWRQCEKGLDTLVSAQFFFHSAENNMKLRKMNEKLRNDIFYFLSKKETLSMEFSKHVIASKIKELASSSSKVGMGKEENTEGVHGQSATEIIDRSKSVHFRTMM